MMPTERFYAELPLLDHFIDATNVENFVSVPDDWFVVITDIAGSTQAIEAGRYKDVNLLGASSIAAVLNQTKDIEVPYVFGGDGASIVIPPGFVESVKPALRAVQQIAQSEFGLELRVGCVPMSVITTAGYTVKIAKLKISEHYNQAMFAGGGLNYATDLIKNSATATLYQLDQTIQPEADFSGLECRWQAIPSQHGEIISLLVLATAHSSEQNHAIYRQVVEKIYAIYGTDEDFHPVALQQLKLSLNSQDLLSETKVRSSSAGWFQQWLYLSQIQFENILGLVFMRFKLKIGMMNWGNYKTIVTTTSDYKKFDDMLRMVISGTLQQRQQLTAYLSDRFKHGELVYGLHVATSALMTCLVFERNGSQVHFVDGAEGGYALAAKPLKEQLKRKANNWQTYRQMYQLRQQLLDQK
ncbi:MAG: DUF3095 domain-containing protein [Leptolyngbyaceae cyanobacterium bins.349]|nr:DUF3095 domain-containing protein [Leptolyngbyaceae cyanobacterium bins.349]